MANDTITPEEEFHLTLLTAELKRKVRDGTLEGVELILLQLEDMTGTARDKPLLIAEKKRRWFEHWYSALGFEITVPLPPVADEEFVSRVAEEQMLCYRPPSVRVDYKDFMRKIGQGENWTVKNNYAPEVTENGYWFWADSAETCPRRNQTWLAIMTDIPDKENNQLISLEEYVIVWQAHKTLTGGDAFDQTSQTHLRTKWDNRPLTVDTRDQLLHTINYAGNWMIFKKDTVGGRAVEILAS